MIPFQAACRGSRITATQEEDETMTEPDFAKLFYAE
jgi:hypothetical protein